MKQLTKEQQEHAVELIEKFSLGCQPSNYYKQFVKHAQAFLQSLKPKVYVCHLDDGDLYYFGDIDIWELDIDESKSFNSIEEARTLLDSIEKYEGLKYFILTE